MLFEPVSKPLISFALVIAGFDMSREEYAGLLNQRITLIIDRVARDL